MQYFRNKFSKLAKRWDPLLPAPLIFDFGDVKLRDMAKLLFFKLIMTKSNFQKIRYDVISVTSSLLHHQNTSPN